MDTERIEQLKKEIQFLEAKRIKSNNELEKLNLQGLILQKRNKIKTLSEGTISDDEEELTTIPRPDDPVIADHRYDDNNDTFMTI